MANLGMFLMWLFYNPCTSIVHTLFCMNNLMIDVLAVNNALVIVEKRQHQRWLIRYSCSKWDSSRNNINNINTTMTINHMVWSLTTGTVFFPNLFLRLTNSSYLDIQSKYHTNDEIDITYAETIYDLDNKTHTKELEQKIKTE